MVSGTQEENSGENGPIRVDKSSFQWRDLQFSSVLFFSSWFSHKLLPGISPQEKHSEHLFPGGRDVRLFPGVGPVPVSQLVQVRKLVADYSPMPVAARRFATPGKDIAVLYTHLIGHNIVKGAPLVAKSQTGDRIAGE